MTKKSRNFRARCWLVFFLTVSFPASQHLHQWQGSTTSTTTRDGSTTPTTTRDPYFPSTGHRCGCDLRHSTRTLYFPLIYHVMVGSWCPEIAKTIRSLMQKQLGSKNRIPARKSAFGLSTFGSRMPRVSLGMNLVQDVRVSFGMNLASPAPRYAQPTVKLHHA